MSSDPVAALSLSCSSSPLTAGDHQRKRPNVVGLLVTTYELGACSTIKSVFGMTDRARSNDLEISLFSVTPPSSRHPGLAVRKSRAARNGPGWAILSTKIKPPCDMYFAARP